MNYEDLRRLPTKTLKKYVQRVGETINKRAENLSNRGWNTYALQRINESGGKITTQGKDTFPALMRELARAREFDSMGTSTIRGAAKQMRFAGELHGGKLTEEQSEKFWKAYRKLEEDKSAELIKQYYGSDEMQEDARKIMLRKNNLGMDDDDLYKVMNDLYESAYREQQRKKVTNDEYVDL